MENRANFIQVFAAILVTTIAAAAHGQVPANPEQNITLNNTVVAKLAPLGLKIRRTPFFSTSVRVNNQFEKTYEPSKSPTVLTETIPVEVLGAKNEIQVCFTHTQIPGIPNSNNIATATVTTAPKTTYKNRLHFFAPLPNEKDSPVTCQGYSFDGETLKGEPYAVTTPEMKTPEATPVAPPEKIEPVNEKSEVAIRQNEPTPETQTLSPLKIEAKDSEKAAQEVEATGPEGEAHDPLKAKEPFEVTSVDNETVNELVKEISKMEATQDAQQAALAEAERILAERGAKLEGQAEPNPESQTEPKQNSSAKPKGGVVKVKKVKLEQEDFASQEQGGEPSPEQLIMALANGDMQTAMYIGLALLALAAFCILSPLICSMIIVHKCQVPAWQMLIPIWNILLFSQVATGRKIFGLMLFIPFIGIIGAWKISEGIAKRFGFGLEMAGGIFVLPMIFLIPVARANPTYTGLVESGALDVVAA